MEMPKGERATMKDRTTLTVAMPACRWAVRLCRLPVHVSPRTFSMIETGQNAGAARNLTVAACGAAEKQCDADI